MLSFITSYPKRYISILIKITIIDFIGNFIILKLTLLPAASEALFLYSKRFINKNAMLASITIIILVSHLSSNILNISIKLDIFGRTFSIINPEL